MLSHLHLLSDTTPHFSDPLSSTYAAVLKYKQLNEQNANNYALYAYSFGSHKNKAGEFASGFPQVRNAT